MSLDYRPMLLSHQLFCETVPLMASSVRFPLFYMEYDGFSTGTESIDTFHNFQWWIWIDSDSDKDQIKKELFEFFPISYLLGFKFF
jgi:hypothetical protein